MLSTIRDNKDLSALIIGIIIICSCLVITPFQLYGQSLSNQISNSNYLQYENSDHKISLLFPSNWNKTERNTTIDFSSPLESESDLFSESLSIEILRSGNIPFREYASLGVIELRQNLERFSLTYSDANFRVSNYPAYKIVYSYINGTTNYDAMRIWAVIGRSAYTISYTAESDNYVAYLPLIETMIRSLRVEPPENTDDESFLNTGGIVLRDSPYNMAVDASRNRVYVTDSRSGIVSVIDGQKDNILTDIEVVGIFPSALDVDLASGRLFVANRDSGTLSVIDGSKNKVIATIQVGSQPVDVLVDSYEIGSKLLIFVCNSASDTVSVIDSSKNKVIATLNVKQERPIDLAVNPITNRLYVADSRNNTVSVIDYYLSENEELRNETVANIQVGNNPAAIDFNPITNRLYVANSDSDTVSVIDGSKNTVVVTIPVGISPYNAEVNTDENLIYIANYLSNTVSVIDGSTNQVVDNMTVNRFPFVVSYNPANKIAYVLHLNQNIVSLINNTDPVIGVTFEINPADSGYINCDGKEFSNGDYFRYNVSTPLDCFAVPNEGFSFSSWSGDLTSRPIPSSETTFEVSKFGNVTADFIALPQIILPWDELYKFLIGVIGVVIAGWSVPAIARSLNGKRQRRHLKDFMTSIDTRNKISLQEPVKYPNRFEDIRRKIEEALAAGNINESQFDILNNKILEYLTSNK